MKIKEKKTMPATNLPYTASYSSNWMMGNPKLSEKVLMAWKGYDLNQWDGAENMIADSVTAMLADGTEIKGRDNLLNGLKAYRGSFASVVSTVDAYMSLKAADKNADVVCIWGSETDTKADGTTQKADLHEVWFFNKDGKLFFLKQYAEQPPKK